MVSLSFWVKICRAYSWISLGLAVILLLLGHPWLALAQAFWAAYLFVVMIVYEYLDEKNKKQLAQSIRDIKKK